MLTIFSQSTSISALQENITYCEVEAAESEMDIVVCVFSSVPVVAMSYEQKKEI